MTHIKPEDRHPFAWAGGTKTGPAGRTYRVCSVCGRPNIGMTHTPKGAGRQGAKGPRGARPLTPAPAGELTAFIVDRIPERFRPATTMAEGDERPAKAPDWRLFAAYHAIVHAEEVHDLDAGLEHALRVAARELDYLLHRRPPAPPKPAELNGSRSTRTVIGPVERAPTLPHIRDEAIRDVARAAARQGFAWKLDGTGHLRFTGPDGRTFTVSTTSSSAARSSKNARADARRAGVFVP